MEKKPLLTIGNFSKKHFILFIIQPITYFIKEPIEGKFKTEWSKFNLNNLALHFGYSFINSIILIIYRIKTGENINRNIKDKKIFFSIKKKNKKQKISNLKVFMYFIIVLSLSYIGILNKNFFKKYNTYEILLKITFTFQIMSLVFLSSYILKLDLYRHHYFSIFLIIIGTIILNFTIFKNKYEIKTLLILIGCLINHFIYPLMDIIGYYIMYKMNMNLNLFLVIFGFIGILFNLFISSINYFSGLKILNFTFFNDLFKIFQKNTFYNLLIFLLISCCNGITYTFLWSIFKLFKPWFFGVSIVSDTVFNYIVKFKQKSTNIFKSILEIIIYLILIFACFIFNEQIICNSCGLNKNCEEEIIMRSNVEFKTLLIEEVSESEESLSN
jgi:hypothetical protein